MSTSSHDRFCVSDISDMCICAPLTFARFEERSILVKVLTEFRDMKASTVCVFHLPSDKSVHCSLCMIVPTLNELIDEFPDGRLYD